MIISTIGELCIRHAMCGARHLYCSHSCRIPVIGDDTWHPFWMTIPEAANDFLFTVNSNFVTFNEI